jgi:hypothetical protein
VLKSTDASERVDFVFTTPLYHLTVARASATESNLMRAKRFQ